MGERVKDNPADDREYRQIEAAVEETERGRWFLREFARRNRAADTDRMIEAVGNLYRAARETAASARFAFIYHDLNELKRSIDRSRTELAETNRDDHAIDPEKRAADVLEAARRTESDMQGAAERIQQIADELRAEGGETDICDELSSHAAGIYMAASFQDFTSSRLSTVIDAMEMMEEHVSRILARFEAEAERMEAIADLH